MFFAASGSHKLNGIGVDTVSFFAFYFISAMLQYGQIAGVMEDS